MIYYLGIDLGTSSVKCLLTDGQGYKICETSVVYDVLTPSQGYAEQSPDMWWDSTVVCISSVIKKSGISPENIKAIGFSGQMHGAVVLDKDNKPVCNAILHCDARSADEIKEAYSLIDKDTLSHIVYNPLFSGFQPVSLLWLRNNRPGDYERIRKVVLPKDYIRFRMTGELGTEVTDASSTVLLDINNGEWSDMIISALGFDRSWFLPVSRPYEIAGTVNSEAAGLTGLKKGTPVVYGVSDQPAQALGNGVVSTGAATSTIGTGGQIFSVAAKPVFNPDLNTHCFLHAPKDTWYIMGATLSAGLALKWLAQNVIKQTSFPELDEQTAGICPGDTPIFSPYLLGERTPHLDPKVRSVFFGLSLEHDYRHMYRAVMEGVVFSLKDSINIIENLGIKPEKIIASGGGAKSDLWIQMQADIYNREISTTALEEQACLGAIILASVGTGEYSSISEACSILVRPGTKSAVPDIRNVDMYNAKYELYKNIYPAFKAVSN